MVRILSFTSLNEHLWVFSVYNALCLGILHSIAHSLLTGLIDAENDSVPSIPPGVFGTLVSKTRNGGCPQDVPSLVNKADANNLMREGKTAWQGLEWVGSPEEEMLITEQKNRQDLHGEEESREYSRCSENVQKSCGWRKPGTHEDVERWNRLLFGRKNSKWSKQSKQIFRK